MRHLALRGEALAPLSPGELTLVVGAAAYSFPQCLDDIVLGALEDILPPPADTFGSR